METQTIKIHKFELAGLGKAPFRFVGQTESKFVAAPGVPARPGSTCDYCGTPIMECYWIRSADGKESKVGCDCILKYGDSGLKKVAQGKRAEKRREQARARTDEKRKTLPEMIRAILASPAGLELKNEPHPHAWRAENGETLWDSYEWFSRNAGAKGLTQVMKELKARGLV